MIRILRPFRIEWGHESSTERQPFRRRQARGTAAIVGSLELEGYVPTPDAEAVHQRVAGDEITTEEAIKIFRDRALSQDTD
jgi:hypothetical protein